MQKERLAHIVLRLGVAFAFLFPAINAWFDPNSWIGYFPDFVHGYVPDLVLLHAFGAVEIVLALWILSGWKIRIPALVAVAVLGGIIIFDSVDFQVLFRDVSIAAAALALAVWDRPRSSSVLQHADAILPQ